MQHGKRIFGRRQSTWRQWTPAVLIAGIVCATAGGFYLVLGEVRLIPADGKLAALPDCDSRESELALRRALLDGLLGHPGNQPTQLRDLSDDAGDGGHAKPGVRPCIASVQVGRESRRIPFQLVPVEREAGFALLLPET